MCKFTFCLFCMLFAFQFRKYLPLEIIEVGHHQSLLDQAPMMPIGRPGFLTSNKQDERQNLFELLQKAHQQGMQDGFVHESNEKSILTSGMAFQGNYLKWAFNLIVWNDL